jgi:hypothetical protein
MAASKPHLGRLQRQVLRCFMACGSTVRTSDLADWCWAEQRLHGRPITRWQRLSTARAAKSVGAAPVSREYREWVWKLRKANS